MTKSKGGPSTIKKRLEQQVALLRRELETAKTDQSDICRKYATTVRKQAGGAREGKESLMLKQRMKMLEKENHEKDQYIAELEEQIEKMPAQYENRMMELWKKATLAEKELNKVYQNMRSIKDEVKEVDQLRDSVAVLKARVERRDLIIAHYEARNSNSIKVVQDLNKPEARHRKSHTSSHASRQIVLPSKRHNTPEPTDVPAESETKPLGSLLMERYKKLQNLRPPKHELRSVDFTCLTAALRMKGNQANRYDLH
ncbi:uncharacterized protein DMAD_06769 [Drosophila madeirensis]|uniref:Uncharacterized protein n=1 Tax=Drosophila madeirensis TaxID=30013 RepID=A0AAU9FTP4_DROMD